MVSSDHILGKKTTILALVNGMIGSSILVLPVVSLQAGWLPTLFIIIFIGFTSLFSSYLAIAHMGDQDDLDMAILKHFNGTKFLKRFYDISVFLGILILLAIYFDLIVLQWQGLLPSSNPSANACLNAAALITLGASLKYFQLGAHLMGYGIISIAGYLIFLIWMIASAPSEPPTTPTVGSGIPYFAYLMTGAFSLQGFFIPVLKNYKDTNKHVIILLQTYLIGAGIYLFIAYVGSFSIANRQLHDNLQTISSYLSPTNWQPRVLEIIILVHLYSVYPEYMFVCKKRFFSIFAIKESGNRDIYISEVVCMVMIVLFCLIFRVFEINIVIYLDLGGAALGFCFSFFLPSLLHIKCAYFAKGKRLMPDLPLLQPPQRQTAQNLDSLITVQLQNFDNREQQLGGCESKKSEQFSVQSSQGDKKVDQHLVKQIEKELDSYISKQLTSKIVQDETITSDINKKLIPIDKQQSNSQTDNSTYYCNCSKPNIQRQIVTILLQGTMIIFGIYVLVDGFIIMLTNIEEQ